MLCFEGLELFVTVHTFSGYAESIESRLRQSALIVDIAIIPDDLQIAEMVEDAARLKFLFAIIINSQNEAHKSLTLNILHGTPQGKGWSVCVCVGVCVCVVSVRESGLLFV